MVATMKCILHSSHKQKNTKWHLPLRDQSTILFSTMYAYDQSKDVSGNYVIALSNCPLCFAYMNLEAGRPYQLETKFPPTATTPRPSKLHQDVVDMYWVFKHTSIQLYHIQNEQPPIVAFDFGQLSSLLLSHMLYNLDDYSHTVACDFYIILWQLFALLIYKKSVNPSDICDIYHYSDFYPDFQSELRMADQVEQMLRLRGRYNVFPMQDTLFC